MEQGALLVNQEPLGHRVKEDLLVHRVNPAKLDQLDPLGLQVRRGHQGPDFQEPLDLVDRRVQMEIQDNPVRQEILVYQEHPVLVVLKEQLGNPEHQGQVEHLEMLEHLEHLALMVSQGQLDQEVSPVLQALMDSLEHKDP